MHVSGCLVQLFPALVWRKPMQTVSRYGFIYVVQ